MAMCVCVCLCVCVFVCVCVCVCVLCFAKLEPREAKIKLSQVLQWLQQNHHNQLISSFIPLQFRFFLCEKIKSVRVSIHADSIHTEIVKTIWRKSICMKYGLEILFKILHFLKKN